MWRLTTSVDSAVSSIRQGRIVAFPTETYYGLAVDPFNSAAVDRLYCLKNRPVDKPLLVLIDEISQLDTIVTCIPSQFNNLIERYWPGPLTLVFPAMPSLHSNITAGTDSVGVRISPHPLAAEFVRKVRHPITATSANLSGLPPACNAEQVFEMFGDEIDLVLDGGTTAAGLPSTVVGLEGGKLVTLRKGQIEITS